MIALNRLEHNIRYGGVVRVEDTSVISYHLPQDSAVFGTVEALLLDGTVSIIGTVYRATLAGGPTHYWVKFHRAYEPVVKTVEWLTASELGYEPFIRIGTFAWMMHNLKNTFGVEVLINCTYPGMEELTEFLQIEQRARFATIIEMASAIRANDK